MKTHIFVFFFLFLSLSSLSFLRGQTIPDSAFVSRKLVEQMVVFPQEKLHLHVDRTLYMPGEKIRFKAYLTDAATNQHYYLSRYVYVELVTPLDSIADRVMIRPVEGLFHGHFLLPDDLPEGDYTLRAYTRYMENQGYETFFRKSIHIGSMLAGQIRPHSAFRIDEEKKKLLFDLFYTKGYVDSKLIPKECKMQIPGGQMRKFSFDSDSSLHVSFDLQEVENKKVLYIEADNYKHYLTIPRPDNDYAVSFFPEGGGLVEGLPCRIAFKAQNANGLSDSISGQIVDEVGEVVVQEVTTIHEGMGLFSLLAQKGERYFLVCTNEKGIEKRFELPEVSDNARSLFVDWRRDNLFVSINKPADTVEKNEFYLMLLGAQGVYYFKAWNRQQPFILFSKDMFHAGIIRVMLLDGKLNPVSERLVFHKGEDEYALSFKSDKPIYKNREKIEMTLSLTDDAGNPIEGDISVAITDDRDVVPDTTMTICSTLLLSSEIKGYIENPAFYFKENAKADYALDLLMMTHGWRRYDITEVLKGSYQVPEILPEEGIVISGEVLRPYSSKPVVDGNISMIIYTPEKPKEKEEEEEKEMKQEEKPEETSESDDALVDLSKTDEKGRFSFRALEFPDSSAVFVHSLNKKGKQNVRVSIEEKSYPHVHPEEQRPLWTKMATNRQEEIDQTMAYVEKATERAKFDNNMRMIQLQEVEIVATRKKKEDKYKSLLYSEFGANSVVTDIRESMTTAHQAIENKAGVNVDYSTHQVVIRGGIFGAMDGSAVKSALLLEDGRKGIYNDLRDVNIKAIARIEIFKGVEAALFYGWDAVGGAVNFVTKRGGDMANYQVEESVYENTQSAFPLGFQQPVEFYSPVYETPEQKSSYEPDLRATLYWKPDLIVDDEGKASFEFYSSDISKTSYSVILEGLTKDGKILRKEQKIEVE